MPGKCATTLPCFSRAGGPSLGAWRHPMLMVDTDAVVVEARLLVGELGCPSCGGALWPWGHARWRSSRRREGTVRHRPRRASCAGCSKTHVLMSTTWLSRRGDAVSVIGSALLAKAAGLGHRRIAAVLGRSACTVRAWLRRFGGRAGDVRVFFTRLLPTTTRPRHPEMTHGSIRGAVSYAGSRSRDRLSFALFSGFRAARES